MKRILSGITPSGDGSLHIGNYLGAVQQFIELSKTHQCFLMFADLHALTTIQNKETLRKNTENLILNEIALVEGLGEKEGAGIQQNVVFFRQSDVPLHTELQSILNNVTPLGLLKRAHAYKDKLAKDVMEDDINLGLFNYPILMAADILLYKPDAVPVGKDQKQHIEITRDIAEKFNKTFSKNVFKLPEPHIPEEVAVILGTDGQRKMSKSLGNIISIFESEDVIRKQVHSCFTDPTRKHATDPGHVEGNMVFTYLKYFGKPDQVKEMIQKYEQGTLGDADAKDYLYESLLSYFAPARKKYAELKENPQEVKDILQKGTDTVRQVAVQTMAEVREAIGLTNTYSFFKYEFKRNDGIISIDDFAAVVMKVGKVVNATHPEKSDKLIRLEVDFGSASNAVVKEENEDASSRQTRLTNAAVSEKEERNIRIIFTGVRPYGFTKDDFIGKQFFFVYNLQPRKMMNEASHGMIMAADGPDGKPIFLSAEGMPIGATIL